MKALGGRTGTEVISLIVDSWGRICEGRATCLLAIPGVQSGCLLLARHIRFQGERMSAKIVGRILILCTLLSMPIVSFGASGPQVTTASGTVEGKEDGAVRVFLGIPYAAPPVGELRWKPPVP